jgi:two-component system, sensor histidine kinase and response regulator
MKTTVLAIEDEPEILNNIVEILELEDMTVYAAQDGEAGVKMARELLPDVIVCDIMMPNKDGYSVLLDLQAEATTANIPFIFLTAVVDRPSQRYGMVLGADDYLTKPFTPDELISAIATRLEKRTRLAQEYASQAEELRQSLLSSLPHELRTPLVGIISGSEMALMDLNGYDHEQFRTLLELIHQSGKRLHRLIENYLLLAQLEIVRLDVERRRKLRNVIIDNPHAVVEETTATKAATLQRYGDLHLNVTQGRTAILNDHLQKIVEELIDNAFKFSAPGTPVTVSAGMQQDKFVLEVVDQGRGMSMDEIKRIGAFMQFGRAHYEQQGSGLGLTIVRQLAELHGGEMFIESEPGRGTHVHVHLPSRPTD